MLAILGILAGRDRRTHELVAATADPAAWLAMIVASLLAAVLGGDAGIALRAAAGAAIAGGLYLLVWLISRGGFGFGDVRFAPLLGAASRRGSWALLWLTLLLGTLAGVWWAAATSPGPPGGLPVRTIDAGRCLRGLRRSPAHLIMSHLGVISR